jgi:hypothetical protein
MVEVDKDQVLGMVDLEVDGNQSYMAQLAQDWEEQMKKSIQNGQKHCHEHTYESETENGHTSQHEQQIGCDLHAQCW